MPSWTAEQIVSPELARLLIAEQFSSLLPAEVTLFGEGWDNTAYLVNGEYVFRFPRRQLGADCLANEFRVLPNIAGRLPLAIPRPEFIGQPGERFRWQFAGYRKIDGSTACAADLSGTERTAMAKPLAEFLAALHAIGVDEAMRLGAGPDPINRLDPERRVVKARESVQRLSDLGLIDNAPALLAVIDETGDARPPRVTSLVHGDLYVRHLLVNDARELCGVIDWGDVHAGDIALDLSIAHSCLPAPVRDEFRDAYGLIDEPTWQLARLRALNYGTVLTLYAHETGDSPLHREGRYILRNVLE